MSYIEKERLLEQVNSLEQLARKRVYDTPTNSPAYVRYSTQYQERESMLSIIKAQPTADVVEVRHGEWQTVDSDLGYVEMKCSLCGHEHLFYTNQGYPYCPTCGAKMDGERKEEK